MEKINQLNLSVNRKSLPTLHPILINYKRQIKLGEYLFPFRKEFNDVARAGAKFHRAEGGLRVVGTLVLIPLAKLQVANQVLAGHTMPVSLERSYPVTGVQMNCTR